MRTQGRETCDPLDEFSDWAPSAVIKQVICYEELPQVSRANFPVRPFQSRPPDLTLTKQTEKNRAGFLSRAILASVPIIQWSKEISRWFSHCNTPLGPLVPQIKRKKERMNERKKHKCLLCSTGESKFWLGTTWGWVNVDQTFIFGWTGSLRQFGTCLKKPILQI